uniref:Uncharacterized protein n=1 Tax=Pseudo-nitzschia australis TaxID=44445 RepID=A0A7S4AEH4_9STRA
MRCVIVVLVVFVAGVHVVHRGETNVNRHQPRSQEYHAIRFQPSSTAKRREEQDDNDDDDDDDDGTRRTMVIILCVALSCVALSCVFGFVAINYCGVFCTVLPDNRGIESQVV